MRLTARLAISIANLVIEALLVDKKFWFFSFWIQWVVSGDTTCKRGTCDEVCRLRRPASKKVIAHKQIRRRPSAKALLPWPYR